MGTFFMSLAGFCLIGYAVMMVLGAVAGDAGIFLTGVLIVGAVVALLVCTLEKLDRVEEKLDKLLAEQKETKEAPEQDR